MTHPTGQSAVATGTPTGSIRRALVLGGGNALGTYHLGACAALLASGWEPDLVVGASIGAVTGAILLGNPPDTRLDRLAEFWRLSTQPDPPFLPALPQSLRAQVNTMQALAAGAMGRPGIFGPRLPGLWSLLPWMPPDIAARDHRPMRGTLERMIDFDRLNAGPVRFALVALDVETGAEVWFDTVRDRITADHLLAATALMPLFPAVEIGDRLLCDAGLASNLPVDRVFAEPVAADHTCIALDLFSVPQGRPATLDETAARAQDILFAAQSRRTIAAAQHLSDCRRGPSDKVRLAHVALRAPPHHRTLKTLDFSDASLRDRAALGRADMLAMLDRLSGSAPTGFTVIRGGMHTD